MPTSTTAPRTTARIRPPEDPLFSSTYPLSSMKLSGLPSASSKLFASSCAKKALGLVRRKGVAVNHSIA